MTQLLLAALLMVSVVLVWLLWEIRAKLDALIDVQLQRLDAMAYERKEVSGKRV